MNNFDEYKLWVTAYTPETIPLGRLAAYLTAFARLLGNADRVHFERIEGGSIKPVAKVEHEAIPKVFERLESIRRGNAANDAATAFKEIDRLARSDNAIAKVYRTSTDGSEAVVLEFPGCKAPAQREFGPFAETIEIVGKLVRIGGVDSTAHATLIDNEGKQWSGAVGKEKAQSLARRLFKLVRISGDVRWIRKEDGTWEHKDLRINSFEAVSTEGLMAAVGKLRALQNSDWAKVADIDAEIRGARGTDDLH